MQTHTAIYKLQAGFSAIAVLLLASVICILPQAAAEVASSSCSSSTAPSADIATAVVTAAYKQWKADYITDKGAGGALRVQRSAGDANDTVSEGIAYGMLFAVYNNDSASFSKLWQYEQTHLDANGLMNWRINANNTTNGYNAATDADEDMALALVSADKAWGGYTSAAKQQIKLIKQYEVEATTNILKPGDVWGGSSLLNPSYFSPSYYDVFQTYTADDSWSSVKDASYSVLNAIHSSTASRTSGLIPDWSDAKGNAISGMSYNFSYDASRSPLRLALASSWSCDAVATNLLASFNASFQKTNLGDLASSYTLAAGGNGNGDSTPTLAAVAASATTSSNYSYRTTSWKLLATTQPTTYFPDSLRLLGLLIASGQFANPLQLSAQATTPNAQIKMAPIAVPNSSTADMLDIWWPSNGAAVRGLQPFKAVLENHAVGDYTMYWQVDGSTLNLMDDSNTDYPHKQANVDLTGWKWHGTGPYTVTYVAKDTTGATIGIASTVITIKQ